MITTSPILLGLYRPQDTFLHQLDARAKLIPIILIMALALIAKSLFFYLTVLALLIIGLLMSSVSIRSLALAFRPILILAVITAAYHLVFSSNEGEVVVRILGVAFTDIALHKASFFSLRLLLFVSAAFLVTLTSSPSELADSLAKILRPLRRIRLPVDDIALIVFMAIRFIPVLTEEFTAIRNAQYLRGVDFSGSFISRTKKLSAIFIPVFSAALSRADDVAAAMQARGYGRGCRTYYTTSRFGLREILFGLLTSALFIGLVVAERYV